MRTFASPADGKSSKTFQKSKASRTKQKVKFGNRVKSRKGEKPPRSRNSPSEIAAKQSGFFASRRHKGATKSRVLSQKSKAMNCYSVLPKRSEAMWKQEHKETEAQRVLCLSPLAQNKDNRRRNNDKESDASKHSTSVSEEQPLSLLLFIRALRK